MAEVTALLGDETAGLLTSWSFCPSFFDPRPRWKREKEGKELVIIETVTQVVCGKGGFTKGKGNKVIFGWFVADWSPPPVLQGGPTQLQQREFPCSGQGNRHTAAASDLMKNTPVSGGHCTPMTLTNYLGIKLVASSATNSVCPPLPALTHFSEDTDGSRSRTQLLMTSASLRPEPRGTWSASN